jgi:hypothetical protein
MLVGAIGGALGMGMQNAPLLLWGVDAVGPLLMLGAVWGLNPQWAAHRFLLDALVAWPGVTALVAWVMG